MDSAVVPSIPLIPSDEERLLREAVAGIASSYGPAYIRSKHEAGLPPSELWDALAEKGYLARERTVWSVPIGAHQGLSHPLAQCKIELELAALMLRKAAALYDAGFKGAGEASNMAKYAGAEAAIHCVDQAIQTHGGNGVAEEYGLSDMWWGVRTMRIAPVSREMILNYVAEHSLGLPRSY